MKNEIKKIISAQHEINDDIEKRIDQLLECLSDNNQFNNLDEVLKWFEAKKEEYDATDKPIDLKNVDSNWFYHEKTGNLSHKSGGFFDVIGVEVSTNLRESSGGWTQPMVDQGTEASVVGIIKKRFNGIPHYLINAKYEPGNYGKLQMSPTLQVTYSNLDVLHKGKVPLFSEYFTGEKNNNKVLLEQWWPEDGGRFYKKRVKNMIVETDCDIELPNYFIWLTMYQIKQLLKYDNIVNCHLRSITSFL